MNFRILIVDWNKRQDSGKQKIFQLNQEVLHISLNQSGNDDVSSESMTDIGTGKGRTVNIPMNKVNTPLNHKKITFHFKSCSLVTSFV